MRMAMMAMATYRLMTYNYYFTEFNSQINNDVVAMTSYSHTLVRYLELKLLL